ncbi:hypothetical protein EQU24_11225 [Methylotuvimicrobium buryatense]|uniref:Uncharacterized protein n=1 Tax=Methylotuvimicrobium buryatense TaxID=95641 RepID=A0A4P9UNF0_METBY|nr:hypothetical protein EQU24_11225 [Methylotuvimicrobium buryatense]
MLVHCLTCIGPRLASFHIPFALQISVVSKKVPGCPAKALSAWSWHRAYVDVFTASFDGHPGAEF